MALPPGLSAFTSDILFALVTRLSQSPWQLNTYTTRDCVDRTTSSGKYQRSLDLGVPHLGHTQRTIHCYKLIRKSSMGVAMGAVSINAQLTPKKKGGQTKRGSQSQLFRG